MRPRATAGSPCRQRIPAAAMARRILSDVYFDASSGDEDDAGAMTPAQRELVQPPAAAAPVAALHMTVKRPDAVHTPRSDPLQPPPVGTVWRWQLQRFGADGADAGPNAIVEAF